MKYQNSLSRQFQDLLKRKIEDQEFLPGEQLPSLREMAQEYHLHRNTITKAVNALIDLGILYKSKTNHIYVYKEETSKILYLNDHSIGKSIGLGAFFNGEKPGSGKSIVLEQGTIPSSFYYHDKLQLSYQEPIYYLIRLRKKLDKVVALEYTYLPKNYFQDIHLYHFDKVSLYDYMRYKHHFPIHFEQRMTVQRIPRIVAKQMQCAENEFVYVLEYIGKDKYQNTVEYTRSFLRCNQAIYGYEINSL